MTGGTLSTTYSDSLGFRALILLIVLSLGCTLRAAAQTTGPVVAIAPPQVTVEPQAAFNVRVTIADAPGLRGYEFGLAYDPAVVEVEAVEQGPFLESLSPTRLGPSIDNQAGTLTFGAFVMPGTGSGPWPSGAGELATIRLKAVGGGLTALDLRDVELFGGDGGDVAAAAEDGQVQVGEGEEVPTETPTEEAVLSDTPAPTSAATATEGTTPPPEATATKTPTGGATSTPEVTESPTQAPPATQAATATEPATSGATAPPEATATGTPGVTPRATSDTAQAGQTPVEGGTPSATVESAGGGGADVEPAATSGDEPVGEETPSGFGPWLVVAVVLGVAGIALISVGAFVFGVGRREAEEPIDDNNA
jgi:hypothetical protein